MTDEEGSERPAKVNYMGRRGCDFGQGYLFSPVVAASDGPALTVRRFLRDPDPEEFRAQA